MRQLVNLLLSNQSEQDLLVVPAAITFNEFTQLFVVDTFKVVFNLHHVNLWGKKKKELCYTVD